MMHTPIKRCRHLGTIDGQHKAAAEFNPFFPVEHVRRLWAQGPASDEPREELKGGTENRGDSVLEVVASILALFAFLTMLGLWIGAL